MPKRNDQLPAAGQAELLAYLRGSIGDSPVNTAVLAAQLSRGRRVVEESEVAKRLRVMVAMRWVTHYSGGYMISYDGILAWLKWRQWAEGLMGVAVCVSET